MTPMSIGQPIDRVLVHTRKVVNVPTAVATQDNVSGCAGTSDVPNMAAIIVGPKTVSQVGMLLIAPLFWLFASFCFIQRYGSTRMKYVPKVIQTKAIHREVFILVTCRNALIF